MIWFFVVPFNQTFTPWRFIVVYNSNVYEKFNKNDIRNQTYILIIPIHQKIQWSINIDFTMLDYNPRKLWVWVFSFIGIGKHVHNFETQLWGLITLKMKKWNKKRSLVLFKIQNEDLKITHFCKVHVDILIEFFKIHIWRGVINMFKLG